MFILSLITGKIKHGKYEQISNFGFVPNNDKYNIDNIQ